MVGFWVLEQIDFTLRSTPDLVVVVEEERRFSSLGSAGVLLRFWLKKHSSMAVWILVSFGVREVQLLVSLWLGELRRVSCPLRRV